MSSTKLSFNKVAFVKSVGADQSYPNLYNAKQHPLPEVAVLGRSNVGKSSLLNLLFQRRNLVKTSQTPGKTQLLNYFNVDDRLAVVDLPGYGFAKVSASIQRKWSQLVDSYLNQRQELRLLLFLLDIRRLPNQADREMLQWIQQQHVPALIVFTKTDKVSRNEKQKQTKLILQALELGSDFPLVHSSAKSKEGRHELVQAIEQLVMKPPAPATPVG